jgi:hypothetical protein
MKVHGLVVEKAKPRRPSTSEGNLRHQNHAKMNIHILGNVMVMQKQNDQKVANHICAKAQHKLDKVIIVVKQCPPLSKPILIKLTSK